MPVTDRKRGEDVARDLGWPLEEVGFLGAAGGLVDPQSAEFRRPRSMLYRVERYQRDRHDALVGHLVETVRRLGAGR